MSFSGCTKKIRGLCEASAMTKHFIHHTKHLTSIENEQENTKHTALWHTRRDCDPLAGSIIKHDPLPSPLVRQKKTYMYIST